MCKKESKGGILRYISEPKYKGKTLTYYTSCNVSDVELNSYNVELASRNLPIFETEYLRQMRRRTGKSYAYGYAQYQESLQKAIYRMCIIGLIDDFTEEYARRNDGSWYKIFELPLFVKKNLNITNISDYTIVNTILSKGRKYDSRGTDTCSYRWGNYGLFEASYIFYL